LHALTLHERAPRCVFAARCRIADAIICDSATFIGLVNADLGLQIRYLRIESCQIEIRTKNAAISSDCI